MFFALLLSIIKVTRGDRQQNDRKTQVIICFDSFCHTLIGPRSFGFKFNLLFVRPQSHKPHVNDDRFYRCSIIFFSRASSIKKRSAFTKKKNPIQPAFVEKPHAIMCAIGLCVQLEVRRSIQTDKQRSTLRLSTEFCEKLALFK